MPTWFFDKVLPALLGLAAGIVGSLIAPLVNWRIEKTREKLAHRRELIGKWRVMVNDIIKDRDVTANPLRAPSAKEVLTAATGGLAGLLERHPDYYSLQPHLSRKTRAHIAGSRTFVVGSTIDTALLYILEEIGNLEKKWGLV